MSLPSTLKTSGIQFYWLIAIGLLAGILEFAYLNFEGQPEATDTLAMIFHFTLLGVSFIAGLVVAFEIKDRFGWIPAIAAFILFPTLLVYWFSRINGIDSGHKDT